MMPNIWGPWQKTEDGVLSSLREALFCSWLDHAPNENGDRCTRCGARRAKLQKYPGTEPNVSRDPSRRR